MTAINWRDRAACVGTDPRVFDMISATPNPDAVRLCGGCPVQRECLTDALATENRKNRAGYRGAMTPDERDIAGGRKKERAKVGRDDMKPCGTLAAYKRHYRNNETPCGPCKAANSAANALKTKSHKPQVSQGDLNGNAKLTEDDVHDIRRRMAQGEPQIQIARHYGVGRSSISSIKSGAAWGHLPVREDEPNEVAA